MLFMQKNAAKIYRQEEECQEKLQVVDLPEAVRQLVSVVAYLR